MSSPSLSPKPPQNEQTYKSDVVHDESQPQITNQETLNHPKSDPETLDFVDPEHQEEEKEGEEDEEDDDEDDDEDEEQDIPETPLISSGMMSVDYVSLNSPNPRNKRKKGKGKGKSSIKKQQAIDEKLQALVSNLNPIPFIPHKSLDFPEHETLLRKLGLWDFVQIEFDRDIRVDLVAQLIATYEAKSRGSYVGGFKIMVNRADLARAFKFPVKKENLDWEEAGLSDDSIGFIVDLVSDWFLLHHEDMWMMPNEVMNWLTLIKDGHPEKVDWAGLVWFMVEKELTQGAQLRDCYYASHLQYLIKSQRGELFSMVEPTNEEIVEFEEEKVNDGEENWLMMGPSTVLTLGQDGENEEEQEDTKELEMMDVDKCNESDEKKWLLNKNLGEHFMQRCSALNDDEGFVGFESEKQETMEDVRVFPNGDDFEREGIPGNLLDDMGVNIRDDEMPPTSSFFNHVGKRVIDHDDHILINDNNNNSNKRLRMNEPPLDFGTCMDQIREMSERARMYHEEKEQALEQANMNQQILLNELQKRDSVIEHMHKARNEEIQKKDSEIYRLERELYLMGSVLDGYRKTLKETQKVFAEYRERAQLPEEPTYKDAGPGGLMLSTRDIEKLKKKQEEEFKMKCLIVEQKMKEAEGGYVAQFDGFLDKINSLDERLTGLGAEAKGLIEFCKERKNLQTEEGKEPEITEERQEEQEEVREVEETHQISQTEEKVPEEVSEPLPNE